MGFGCADEHLHFNHARLRCQSIAAEEAACIQLDEERRRLAARVVFYSHASYVAREYMEPIQTGLSQLTEKLAKARATTCTTYGFRSNPVCGEISIDNPDCSQKHKSQKSVDRACAARAADAIAKLPQRIQNAEAIVSHLTKAAKQIEDRRDSLNEQMNRALAESRKRKCHPESAF